jgi:16S rRNA A1518/A1519 N6-dimethyltransferase RsmA/KsgA/DIM1 with predicted DNA glycosylase/AP lyase activity
MASSTATRLQRLYRGATPYAVSQVGPGGRHLRRARSHTYGELTQAGIDSLVALTRLQKGDHFVDIGSGAGKVVLSVVMNVPGVTALGVEVDGGRHAIASQVLAKAEAKVLVPRNRARFVHADACGADLTQGTVFFACSTCFPQRQMNALARSIATMPNARVFVALTELPPRVAARFAAHENHPCITSWTRYARFYLYWVRPLPETS